MSRISVSPRASSAELRRRQHDRRLLGTARLVRGQLSRFVTKEDQAATLAALKDGSLDVVIGTHRLLSKDVHFKQLGLLIVDAEGRSYDGDELLYVIARQRKPAGQPLHPLLHDLLGLAASIGMRCDEEIIDDLLLLGLHQ